LGEPMIALSIMIGYMSIIVVPLVILAHFCSVVFGVILVFQGKINSYPLTVKFLNESP
jgi:uncharacterized Tic20 family protein